MSKEAVAFFDSENMFLFLLSVHIENQCPWPIMIPGAKFEQLW
jgi:hypothetical protein